MAHVFISYSSRDRDITRSLADALERTSVNGGKVTVWWDRHDDGLQAGDAYWRKIAEALERAQAVIVLWSDNSIVSDWVYSEACRGKGSRKIVALSIAGRLNGPPPMPFDVLHTPALADIPAAMPEIVRAIEARIARAPLPIAAGRNRADLDQDVLELKRDPMPADVLLGPGDFLKARNQTGFIDFIDANGHLAALLDWSRLPAAQAYGRTALAKFIHGAGGFGKTRLLIELALQLEKDGWLVGFVPRGLVGGPREAVLRRLMDDGRDAAGLLLVVDYVEQRQAEATWIAERLAQRSVEEGRRPARLVMLARGAGEWWQTWLDETPALQRLVTVTPARPGVAAAVDVVRLSDSFPGSERVDLFEKAFEAFRTRTRALVADVPPVSDALVALIESDTRYARPLAIQMAALLYAYGYDPAAGVADMSNLLGNVLGLERDHWNRALKLGDGHQNPKQAIGRVTAKATLCLGVPGEDKARGLIASDPRIAEMKDIDPPRVLGMMRLLYPREDGGIAQLEPDLLGEHHVAETSDVAIVDACLAVASQSPELRENIFTVLLRATRAEHGAAAERAVGLLAHIERAHAGLLPELIAAAAKTPSRWIDLADGATLEAINGALPPYAISLLEFSLVVARRRLDLAQNLVASADASAPPEAGMALQYKLANAFDTLGIRYSNLKRLDDALEASEEAVTIRRDLYRQKPDVFAEVLASSLNNISVDYSNLKRLDDALKASEEAVTILRHLYKQKPDVFAEVLANSLSVMSDALRALRRSSEGAAATREGLIAVLPVLTARPAIHRDLALMLHHEHIEASEEAGQEPDAELLERVARACGLSG